MKTLRDYEGAEGVAKFAEIEPYISEIIKDSNINIAEMRSFQIPPTLGTSRAPLT